MEILFARASVTVQSTGTALTDSQAKEAIEAGAARLQVAVGDTAFRPFLGLPTETQEMLARLMGASLCAMRDSRTEALQAEAREMSILADHAYKALQAQGTVLLEAREAVETAVLKCLTWAQQAELGQTWACAACAVLEADQRHQRAQAQRQQAYTALSDWRESAEQMGYARH